MVKSEQPGAPVTGILFAFGRRSCGFETDGLKELVEIVDDALVEAVELGPVLAVEFGVGFDGREEAGGERGVHLPKSFRKTRQLE